MGTITGAVNFRGGALPPVLNDRMGSSAPGGIHRDRSNPRDLRSFLMCADAASFVEAPGRGNGQKDTVALGLDGRLDNRDTLLRSCDMSPNATDADLALGAYRRWKSQCFVRLLGDFAIAVWDPLHRHVLLARDPFGTRPLFYRVAGDVVMWSSELAALIAADERASKLDDDYVAGFLTGTEEWELTPYTDIRCVGPGAVVTVDERGSGSRAYWQPDPTHMIQYGSDAEYEDRFRELLRGGISARLRTEGPVFAELSGGLDSSSIVCMAADLLLHRRGALQPVTYVYPDSPTSRETPFRAEIERRTGLTSLLLEERHLITPLFDASPSTAPNPMRLFDGVLGALGERMRTVGARVLLSGHGGDHLMMHAARRAPELADLLCRGEILTVIRHLRGYRKQWNRAYGELIWSSIVWPMLPPRLRPWAAGRDVEPPRWFNRSFARRTAIAERWIGERGSGGFRTCSGQWQFGLLHQAISMASSCYYRDCIRADVTYPYLHRPLVEFLLAIPSRQKTNPGEMRSVQRRALRGLLPEPVRTRLSKSGVGEVICRAVNREWPRVRELMSDARLVAHGYIDRAGFHAELLRVRSGIGAHVQPVSRALVLEAWLRARS